MTDRTWRLIVRRRWWRRRLTWLNVSFDRQRQISALLAASDNTPHTDYTWV